MVQDFWYSIAPSVHCPLAGQGEGGGDGEKKHIFIASISSTKVQSTKLLHNMISQIQLVPALLVFSSFTHWITLKISTCSFIFFNVLSEETFIRLLNEHIISLKHQRYMYNFILALICYQQNKCYQIYLSTVWTLMSGKTE